MEGEGQARANHRTRLAPLRELHQVDHQRIGALAALEVAEPLGGVGIIERFENILALVLGAFFERTPPAFMKGFLDVGLQVRRAIGELLGDDRILLMLKNWARNRATGVSSVLKLGMRMSALARSTSATGSISASTRCCATQSDIGSTLPALRRTAQVYPKPPT